MDKTKEYAKMCLKAEEIQEMKLRYSSAFGLERKEFSKEDFKVFVEGRKHYTWLPRQDQLQAMLTGYKLSDYELEHDWQCALEDFYTFLEDQEYYEDRCFDHALFKKYQSMEQIWLAFVMQEKFQKTWDEEKEDWVKIR